MLLTRASRSRRGSWLAFVAGLAVLVTFTVFALLVDVPDGAVTQREAQDLTWSEIRRVAVVGVDRSDGWSSIVSVHDAVHVARAFSKPGPHVQYQVGTAIGGKATSQSIRNLFSRLQGEYPPDWAIIYLSGHGWATSGGDAYFLPAEGDPASGTQLVPLAHLTNIKARQRVLILDLNHASPAFEDFLRTTGSRPLPTPGFMTWAREERIQVVFACSPDQRVASAVADGGPGRFAREFAGIIAAPDLVADAVATSVPVRRFLPTTLRQAFHKLFRQMENLPGAREQVPEALFGPQADRVFLWSLRVLADGAGPDGLLSSGSYGTDGAAKIMDGTGGASGLAEADGAYLDLESVPEDIPVHLGEDRRLVGRTPARFYLSSGEHLLTLSPPPAYEHVSFFVDILPGQDQQQTLFLEKSHNDGSRSGNPERRPGDRRPESRGPESRSPESRGPDGGANGASRSDHRGPEPKNDDAVEANRRRIAELLDSIRKKRGRR